ncbi:SHOCT domain-containing protein [Streptomyces sp. TR06-5]|uniref:SHOCT domain-containing protein n=1 Tax=unclassified Streptomyces TaxID=2593676 RepID=UPI00399F5EC1
MHALAHGAGTGPGPWILLVPLLWALVVIGGVALLRRTVRRGCTLRSGGLRRAGAGGAKEGATDLLARRFAAGEIDEDEYWLRLAVLNESRESPA